MSHAFTPKEIKILKKKGVQVRIPAGWAPVTENTVAEKIYIVLSGEASVRKQGQEIARLQSGDFLGELGHEVSSLRSATVVALTDLQVLHFTPQAWEEAKKEMPSLAKAVKTTVEARKSV